VSDGVSTNRDIHFSEVSLGSRDGCVIVGQDQSNLLDNPVWSALSTTHASFAEGDDLAKRYPVDAAPFAATRDQSAESYHSLARLLGPEGTAAFPLATMPVLPTGWTVVRRVESDQMVWNTQTPPLVEHSFEELNISHVDEMLALVELTKPGPFRKRTPELGSYLGIREAGQLVAMAGERLKPCGFTEISAVCTHPDHRGRGYASSLVSSLIQTITNRNEIPFLHVRTENVDAMRVYEKLGFKTRRIINIAIVKPESWVDH
jgi:predicted GNAT family acetyltransferase